MRKYKGRIYYKDLQDTYWRNDKRTLKELLDLPDGVTTFVAYGIMSDNSRTYVLSVDDEERNGYRPNGAMVQFQKDKYGTFYIMSVDNLYSR